MGEVQLAWPPLKFYTRPTKFDTLTWQGLLFKSLVQLPIFTINCINQICVLGTAAVVLSHSGGKFPANLQSAANTEG